MKWSFLLLFFVTFATPAFSHAWYVTKQDPVYKKSCCGGEDCKELNSVHIVVVAEGLHVRLTAEEARKINPNTILPIDTVLPWDRVQPSEDGNIHICLEPVNRAGPLFGVYCIFWPLQG